MPARMPSDWSAPSSCCWSHATEAQQYFRYISCLAAAAAGRWRVRTGDVGADDAAPWVEDVRRAAENRRQLRTQITALLRAGTRGPPLGDVAHDHRPRGVGRCDAGGGPV